jgi:putative FmdB family regulatory protein
MAATLQAFRCMMCGHEYQELADLEEDKERSCPRCRSNSIRYLRKKAAAREEKGGSKSE